MRRNRCHSSSLEESGFGDFGQALDIDQPPYQVHSLGVSTDKGYRKRVKGELVFHYRMMKIVPPAEEAQPRKGKTGLR